MDNNKHSFTPFEEADRAYPEYDRTRKLINGKVTERSECLGYCSCETHKGFLTQKLMAEHDCRNRGCANFCPKTGERQKKKEEKADVPMTESRILEIACRLAESYKNFKIYSAKKDENGEWTLLYAALDSNYRVSSLEKFLEKETSETVHIVYGNLSEEKTFEVLLSNSFTRKK